MGPRLRHPLRLCLLLSLALPAAAGSPDVERLLRAVPLAPGHYAPQLGYSGEDGLRVDVRPESGRATVFERDHALPEAVLWRARSGDGAEASGLFGRGWRSLLDARVHAHGEGLAVVRPQGLSLFVPLEGDVLVSVAGPVELLRRGADGYELLTAGGRRLRFDPQGALLELEPGFRIERRPERWRLLDRDDRALAELRLDRGRVVRLTAADEVELRYGYDEQGRLVSVAGAMTRAYAHDAGGRLERVVTPTGTLALARAEDGRLTALAAPGVTQRYDHSDGLAVQTPRGRWRYRAVEGGWEVQTPAGDERVWLDARGRPRAVQAAGGARLPYRRARDDDPWPERLPGGEVARVFDEAGRLVAVEGPGAREAFVRDADGRVVARTTVDGRTAKYAYDEQGRLVSEQGPEGRTAWTWTEDQRLAAVETPGGRRWSLRWDAGRLAGEDGPMGPVAWQRDASGRPLARRDASGRVTRYRYDDRGRPCAIRSGAGQQVALGYDLAGRLARWTDGDRVEQVRRDTEGRPLEVRSGDLLLRYHHDAEGGEVETPWGPRRWRLDAAGRVAALETPAGAFSAVYDGQGQRVGLRYPNGVEVTQARDALDRVTDLIATAADGSELLRVRSRWNASHERERRELTSPLASWSERYAHDDAGRLSGWTAGSASWSCTYGPDGDRVLERCGGRDRDLRHDARGRLVARGDEALRYDEAGRLLARKHAGGIDRFGYDGFGRLVSAQRAGSPRVDYGYDPLGRVAERRVGESLTRFVWEGHRLLAELGPGDRERVYVYGPELDEPLAVREDGRWTYLVHNELHHLLLRVDADGRPLEHVALSPWGEPLRADPTRPLFFAGRLYDPLTRLYPLRARFYDPELGRFLTPDPAGLRGGVNAYAYVRGRPLDRIDPLGAWDWVPDWAARGAAWVEQQALPAVVDAGEFLRGYGEFVWEDVQRGAARDRIFGTVDAYAQFLTFGLVDPHLSSLAGDPEEAARGRIYGEAAGWVFAAVSGRELIKQGALGLVRGARALPGTVPRLPGLLRRGAQQLPGALRAMPGRGKAWAGGLPAAAWGGAQALWANKLVLAQSLGEFLHAQGTGAWRVTGGPFVSLYRAVVQRGREATAWLRARRGGQLAQTTRAGRGARDGVGATQVGAEGASASGATGSTPAAPTDRAGIRDVLEGRTRKPGVKGHASVHAPVPAWLEQRFGVVLTAVREGRVGPQSTAPQVRAFLDETYEHVHEVNALVRAMGGKVRPIPTEAGSEGFLRGVHDLGEAVSIRRLEGMIAELRRNPLMNDGVPLEVPAWLARLPAEARAAGQTAVDVGKLNPHVAAGLSLPGRPDPFALALHRLSPHHAHTQGAGNALIETVADVVNAMRQARVYRPQPLPFDTIRQALLGQIQRGDLSADALPLIERAIEAQRALERSGQVNPYHLLEGTDDAVTAVRPSQPGSSSAAAVTESEVAASTGAEGVTAATAVETRRRVGQLLARLRSQDDAFGSAEALGTLEEAAQLWGSVARAGNRSDQALLAGLRYETELQRVRLGRGSMDAYERLVGTLQAGLDASVPHHVTKVSNLPGILKNGLRSGDGYGVYFNNPATQEAVQLGRGGAVLRVKPEFADLYRFERSHSAESLHGVVAVDARGAVVDVIPGSHLEAVPLSMPAR